MAFSQSDVDALKRAIASGVKSVTFADGRNVNYRDTSELMSALALAQQEVAAAATGGTSVSYASFSKE